MGVNILRIMPAFVLLLLAGFSAVGWGSALSRILRIQPNTGERGLLGLLCLGITGAMIHFMVPISPAVQYACLGAGILGLAFYATDIGTVTSVSLSAVAFTCVFLHPRPGPFHDNGLYHMPTIQWITHAPLIPGIVNLHGRLAFNSLFFIIEAYVDQIPIGWVGNSLIALFIVLAAFERLVAQWRKQENVVGFWFLITYVALFIFGRTQLIVWLGQTDADGVVAALIAYWSYLLLEYAQQLRDGTVSSLLILLAAFAVMCKLSAAPALIFTMGLVLLRDAKSVSRRTLIATAAFLLIWCSRGFLQSGCALYPLPQSCVYSVPWATGVADVEGQSLGARSWARVPGEINYAAVLANWAWFRPWLSNIRQQPITKEWLIGVALGICGILHHLFFRRALERGFVLAAIASLIGIGYWFWAAPDPRFGRGFITSFAVLGASLFVAPLLNKPVIRRTCLVMLFGVGIAWTAYSARDRSWMAIAAIPKTLVVPKDLSDGRRIWIPYQGDQCWDTLPCVPAYTYQPEYFTRVQWRAYQTSAPRDVLQPVHLPLALPIRVNAGGEEYRDSNGNTWTQDIGFLNGAPYREGTGPIAGTNDPDLYRTFHFVTDGSLVCEFPVPNGDYVITLRFAETFFESSDRRVFDVSLNDTLVYSHLDVFKATGGKDKALDLSYKVRVTNGKVTISLAALKSNAMISGLEILPAKP